VAHLVLFVLVPSTYDAENTLGQALLSSNLRWDKH
jgi:hypothetical protein